MLQALVEHFDRDAADSRRQVRELFESDPEGFYASALQILKNRCDSRGCQYLVTLFVAYGLLARALCDARLNREQALALARSAARVDSMVDVSLAKILAASCGEEGTPLPSQHASRLMEVLGEISDGSRIQASLMRLLRHPNGHLRSKAVKMIGRGSQSVRWVQSRLKESDPRVRANAVESLWGLESEGARALLDGAARDGNNRVAGNALLGLYRLGDTSAIPGILQMGEHESALFRSTAAWLMGETGDPRFSEALARLMRDSSSAVRSRSLSALGRIKAAVAQSRRGEQWLVSAFRQPCIGGKINRRLRIAVAGEARTEPNLLGPQFLVCENGQAVTHYKFLQKDLVEPLSVVFAVPREMIAPRSAWVAGMQASLRHKRGSDLWAVSAYLLGEGAEAGEVPTDETSTFAASTGAVEQALVHPPARIECVDLWRTILRAVRSEQGQNRGKRHVILFSDGEPYRSAGDGLVATVQHSGATVQVIATRRNPKVESFCRRAHADYRIAENEEDAARLLEMAYLNLLARCEITWHTLFPEPGDLKVRITAPSGWGEAAVPAPPREESP